jgi:hypothetical protein
MSDLMDRLENDCVFSEECLSLRLEAKAEIERSHKELDQKAAYIVRQDAEIVRLTADLNESERQTRVQMERVLQRDGFAAERTAAKYKELEAEVERLTAIKETVNE